MEIEFDVRYVAPDEQPEEQRRALERVYRYIAREIEHE